MTDKPAHLHGDDHVILTPRGVRMVLASLELTRRAARDRNGGARLPGDFEWLAEVLRIAAEPGHEGNGYPEGTAARPITIVMRASRQSRQLTTAEAAKILGIGRHAIVKAIRQGRIAAERHGRTWLLAEDEVRQRARANGRQAAEAK